MDMNFTEWHSQNEYTKMTTRQYKILGKPAANGRFGAIGAVARPKVCADLEVLCPSERQWKPRLRQAAGTL
jgi:hypothetical protein